MGVFGNPRTGGRTMNIVGKQTCYVSPRSPPVSSPSSKLSSKIEQVLSQKEIIRLLQKTSI